MAITANKLLGKKEKGGSLAVRPTTSLTSYKGLESSDTKKPESDNLGKTLFTIQKKIILVDDLLKGTFAEKKKRQKDEVKQKEDEARAKQEKDQEKPDNDDSEKETPKSLIPKLSFLDGIKKFISEVLVGWLTFNLINFLPQVLNAVKFLGNIADFVIEFGGKLLDGLVTFIDIGYDAYEKTSEWVGDAFGEDKQKQFENFASTLTKFLNVAIIAAMVGSKMGMFGMGADRGVRRGIINKGKRVANRVRRFFDPKRAEKLARLKKLKEIAKKRKAAEAALKRARMLRKLRPTNLRRVARVVTGKPLRAVSNVIQSPAVQNVAKTTQNLIKNPGQTVQNLRQAGADKLDDVAKNVGKSKWFSNLKGAGKNIWGKLGQAKDFLGKQGKSFINWADDFGKKFMASADEIVKGVMAQGSKWATQIGDVAQMAANPGKLLEKAKGVLSGQLDDILKQNKTIAQLKNLNPKDAAKSIKGILNNAKKSKGLLQVRNALKGAQKMKIGGVDKVIAALMGLLDYTVFKESPINAILRALGGLLGYTAGFAIGAPFGGAPGFITGMAGGFVGEKAAMLVAKLLAKTPLAQIPDPIMNDGRMLVRDPDGQSIEEESTEKTESKKLDKTFKMGKKEYDLSKLQGGLTREEYDDLSNKDRGILNRRMRMYASQNTGNANNIVPTSNARKKNLQRDIERYGSYEDGAEETIVIKRGSETGGDVAPETETKESITPVSVGGGGGDSEVSDALYKSG